MIVLIKKILKKIPFVIKIKDNLFMKFEFIKDYNFFVKNYSKSKQTLEKIEYNMLLITHSLEKGMSNSNPRIFGKEKINNLINYILMYEKLTYDKSYSYKVALNCLLAYSNFYKINNWNNHSNKIIVDEFLERYKDIPKIKVGSHELKKEDITINFDYNKFIETRHSVRTFSNKRLLKKDVDRAIEAAILSPTACNRQMCKIYNISEEKNKDLITKYAQGLGNFDLSNINYFIITFDVNAFYFSGERNQGWFNAGLVSMNFVNALHSLGIGTCFIQFGNSFKQEEIIKEKLKINKSERIAVLIAAGYYAETSKIPYSPRKDKKDIYFER